MIVLTTRHRYLTKTVLLKALSKRKMATTALCSKQGVEGAVSFRLVGRLNDLFTSPPSVPTFSAFLSWSCDRRHERDEGEEPWWPSLSTVLHPAGPACQRCFHLLKLHPNEWLTLWSMEFFLIIFKPFISCRTMKTECIMKNNRLLLFFMEIVPV